MSNFILLAVDDDQLVTDSLKISTPDSWSIDSYSSLEAVPAKKTYNAALIDIHLSGKLNKTEGIELIEKLHKANPHLEIVAMSGDLNRELMEKCLKAGASRFLAKPLNLAELKLTLDKIEAYLLLQSALGRGQKNISWIGNSEPSQKIKKQIADLTGEEGPLLIEGESGTGKEVTASLIHNQRPNTPFIAINVAAVPENLFESEFFGHTKGSFTGAENNKMGLAEAAHGGDLFLDEIEALSLNLQVKLLRFLEDGEVRRIGSKESVKTKCRVIIATNEKLETLVKEKKFREDLLWRINGKKISLPPLRERKEDIPLLVKHFFKQDRVRQKEISKEAFDLLTEYNWPGNIRELKRVCEQLIANAPLPVVRDTDIKQLLKPSSNSPIQAKELDLDQGLPKIIASFEAQIIKTALEKYKDIDETSKALKISRSSLYKKIKDHDIEWKD